MFRDELYLEARTFFLTTDIRLPLFMEPYWIPFVEVVLLSEF